MLAHRASDLVRLSLHGRAYTPEGVVLLCKGLAKQTKPGNEKSLQPVVISDKKLCPVACLQAYERATAAFRTNESAAQLFLALVPPHQPISSARCFKISLEKAGLDPEFTAHSTRSASSTTASMSGVSTQEIMNRAGWFNKGTLC